MHVFSYQYNCIQLLSTRLFSDRQFVPNKNELKAIQHLSPLDCRRPQTGSRIRPQPRSRDPRASI